MRGVALATVVLAVLVAGCASTGPTPTSRTLSHYADDTLSFDYPSGWNAATFPVMSSFTNLLVYLSTSPLADPCDRTPSSIQCVRSAATSLAPDGILVDWTRASFPGWTFDPTHGDRVEVGGRRATLERLDPSERCAAIGGERELLVTIDDPIPDQNWTEMRACLRGPSQAGLEAQVRAMLSTVAWSD